MYNGMNDIFLIFCSDFMPRQLRRAFRAMGDAPDRRAGCTLLLLLLLL